MPYLQENPDADALMVRDYLEGEGVRVARDEDAERFLLAAVARVGRVGRVGRVRQLKQYHQKPKRPVR